MLSRDLNCAFVHIPKTGGSSIERLLTGRDWITASPADYAIFLAERAHYRSDWGGTLCEGDGDYFARNLARKHASQAELRAELGADWALSFKFTFVRNPWERLLSIFEHGRRDGPDRMPSDFGDWLAADDPLDHMGQAVFRPLVDRWEEFDWIGRFERFADDFAPVARALGLEGPSALLPHERHGSRGRRDLTRLDPHSVAIIARREADVIERFGYRFEAALSPSSDAAPM